MSARDWFGVGTRLVGLWQLTIAVQNLLYFLDVRLGFSPLRGYDGRPEHDGNPNVYLLYVCGYTAFSFYLLFWTSHLVGLSFPSLKENATDQTGAGDQRSQPNPSSAE